MQARVWREINFDLRASDASSIRRNRIFNFNILECQLDETARQGRSNRSDIFDSQFTHFTNYVRSLNILEFLTRVEKKID